MPVVRMTFNFEMGEDKQSLADAFHEMMQDVLKIKAHDRLILIDENPAGFFQPLDTEGRYAWVEIRLFPGRSAEVKRRLYRRIVRLLEPYGVPVQNTRIVIHEMEGENWGIRGGKAACDVDLGYSTHI